MAGLILGPTVIDLLGLALFNSTSLEETVLNLAELGAVLMMFIAGMEVDLNELRNSGRVAVLGGLFGVVLPWVMGAAVAIPFGYVGDSAVFVGIILTATSVSISAQTLLELGVLRTREGLAMLGAAVVDDILVIVILSVFLALAGGGKVTPIDIDTLTFASAMEAILAVSANKAAPSGSDVAFKKRDGATTKVTITYGGSAGERTGSVIS